MNDIMPERSMSDIVQDIENFKEKMLSRPSRESVMSFEMFLNIFHPGLSRHLRMGR